jgi:hypothetical protein
MRHNPPRETRIPAIRGWSPSNPNPGVTIQLSYEGYANLTGQDDQN